MEHKKRNTWLKARTVVHLTVNGMSLLAAGSLLAADLSNVDIAERFGARESVSDLHLSPDGTRVSFITPIKGQGAAAYTFGLQKGAKPNNVLSANGKPWRLDSCNWIATDRLVCDVYALTRLPEGNFAYQSRVMAVNDDGSNVQILSTQQNIFSRAIQLYGGDVLDLLPNEDAAVLMTRVYIPDDHVGTLIGTAKEGLGVDRIDTRTLKVKPVVSARRGAWGYISDGQGVVRILEVGRSNGVRDMNSGVIDYLYRPNGSLAGAQLLSHE